MASSRLTLAQQLAQLEDPTPIDIDPEDDFLMNTHGEDEVSAEEDSPGEGKAHYLTVDRSNLRTLHESLNESKYAGEKITRELGDLHLSDDNEGLESSEESASSKGTGDEEEESNSSSSDEEMDASPVIKESEDLSNVLQRARESDRAKGKAVSKQMAIWDSILDARIRLQKGSSLCNTLPLEPNLGRLMSEDKGRKLAGAFLREALLLSEDLFELNEVLTAASGANINGITTATRKRKRLEPPSDDMETLAAQVQLASKELTLVQQRSHPHLLTTLQKWSNKIQAVTPASLLPSSRNAFRSNRNANIKPVTELIQESLADHSRTVARTRIRRGAARLDASEDGSAGLDIEGKPLEEAEVFDDADFYQQLLRDVIDGQTSNGYGDEDLNTRPKKIKKKVDTRASKGRKLRYEVHEKMQNFMVPIPTIVDGWHEEKIDELFSSLLGKTPTAADKRMQADNSTAVLVQDGFRVFG